MTVQIAATMSGDLAAVGPAPVTGARHDAHAFAASGLKDLIAGMDAAADLGYTGVDGITIVPFRTPPGGRLHESRVWVRFNKDLSAIRAAVERAVAHLKTWRMLSEEGGRFRPPLSKFETTLTAIIGLFFFSTITSLMNKLPAVDGPPPRSDRRCRNRSWYFTPPLQTCCRTRASFRSPR